MLRMCYAISDCSLEQFVQLPINASIIDSVQHPSWRESHRERVRAYRRRWYKRYGAICNTSRAELKGSCDTDTLEERGNCLLESCNKFLSELFLRKDDVFYEDLKKSSKQRKEFQSHVKHFIVSLKSHCDAILKVIDGLGEMPTSTLSAMCRKLKEPLAKAMVVAGLNSKLLLDYEDLFLTRFAHVTPEHKLSA
ncbi:hypothetical protein Cgig2_031715 [Carnegiea gigantea]|uniref:Uncharacterized protein n=1 Tax=Carnegiea gigantea TaxID=171969 RepID=A0A9Q1QN65_9CARY|nr:hypothetical protein Cgig2_031715 [Carnegiea gigantea]